MTIKVAFEECLKDSPRFRSEIEAVQADVGELETRLEKLLKQCQAMLEAGRVYYQTGKNFVSGLQSLGQHCSGDTVMEECLRTFSEKLSLILDAQGEVIETTQKSVKTKLQTFVKEDVRRFKDARKEFERSSESLEGALARNAQAPRGKSHEVEEASGALLNARRAFRSGALDYVLEINIIEAKKKTELLMAMLSLMDSQVQLFQNGHRSLSELDRYRQKLSEEHTQFVLNSAREKRDMEQRHAAIKQKDVSYDDSMMDFNPDAADGVAMEGYLNKRASNAFKTWSRRWFSIQKNQLVYQKKFKCPPGPAHGGGGGLASMHGQAQRREREAFLLRGGLPVQKLSVTGRLREAAAGVDQRRAEQHRLGLPGAQGCPTQSAAAVQLGVGGRPRRRSGERVPKGPGGGPGGRREPGVLRLRGAESRLGVHQPRHHAVHRVLGNTQVGSRALTRAHSSGPRQRRVFQEPGGPLLQSSLPHAGLLGAGTREGNSLLPLCEQNGGLKLLTFDGVSQLMCELGNGVINGIYEARMDEITLKKPLASSPRGDKEAWIRSKYVEKKFIQKLPETARKPSQNRPGAKRNRAATQERGAQRPPLKPKPSRSTLPRSGNAEPKATGPSEVQKDNAGSHTDVNGEEEDLSGLHPGALLYRSAALQNFPVMADALAHGADVNWVNAAEEACTPLIRAVSANALAACEFLLQNGADVNQADRNGRGPLHHATILGHTGLVCLFLKRGADYNARDKNHKDPITIAVDNANADIVTLLRIAKMNREMQEMDGCLGKSDTGLVSPASAV